MKKNNYVKFLIKTKHDKLIYLIDCKGFTNLYNLYYQKKDKNQLYNLLENKEGYYKYYPWE